MAEAETGAPVTGAAPSSEPAAAGKPGWLRRGFGIVVGVVVLGGVGLALWTFVFGWPFNKRQHADGGSIFVHGPQVYTRERLVNDRYQEDSWLNGMLDRSTSERFGYTASRGQANRSQRGGTLNVGTPEGPTEAGRTPAAPAQPAAGAGSGSGATDAQGLPDISEQPTFRLQATRAYREQIRTMLIENQLDDRHDLHGNTLYRLRFDATILPSEGSQSAAQIEILIDPPSNNTVPQKIRDGATSYDEFTSWLESWRELYFRWRTSLELRLEEEAVARARNYENGRFGPDDYDALLGRLRGSILLITRQIDEVPKRIAETRKQLSGPKPTEETPAQARARKETESLTNCVAAAYKAASEKLTALRKSKPDDFPAFDKLDPVESKSGQKLKEFREAFLRGALDDDEPLEKHDAHDIYRDRIRDLLVLRRDLMQLIDTNQCDAILRGLGFVEVPAADLPQTETAMPTPAAAAAPAPAPAPAPPPSPGAPGAPLTETTSDKTPPPQQQQQQQQQALGSVGVSRPDALWLIDAAQLQRRLLNSEFWPRIYKAVTGVDESIGSIDDALPRADLRLSVTPPSLSRFADVVWEPQRSRRAFQVNELKETLTVASQQACLSVPAYGPSEPVTFVDPATGKPQTLFVPRVAAGRLRAIAPELKLAPLLVAASRSFEQKLKEGEGLSKQSVAINPCDFRTMQIDVPVGLFNFAMRLSQAKEVYTYSISPAEPDELIANRIRGDLLREFGVQARLNNMAQGNLPVGAGLKAQEEIAKFLRFDTVQRSVFGYGEKAAQAKIGWQVLPRDQAPGEDEKPYLAPKQIPMTALISLPAWWDKVTLTVNRAWIDGQGRVSRIDPGKPLPSYSIDLPTNFETLDASLFANADTGPVLIDWQIPRLAVRPCQPFSVTLIGRRLWRSTVVTLAGERANRVVVMPNMNGIIATFDKAPRPGNLPDKDDAAAPPDYYAQLTIWTSQGHVHLPRLIKVERVSPSDQACTRQAEAPPKTPPPATPPPATPPPATPPPVK